MKKSNTNRQFSSVEYGGTAKYVKDQHYIQVLIMPELMKLELMSSKVYNSIKHLDGCALTTDKNNYDMEMMNDRIKPDLLNAFRKNPYTHPLSSTR